MPRKRTVTAARTTTTTVTECVTATEEYPPIEWAPGWDPNHGYSGISARELRAQREGQVWRTMDFLELWAVSNGPGAPVPDRLVRDAAVILRAGPAATPLEQHLGRSI